MATTEAPSYRRVALERMRADGMSGEQIKRSGAYRGFGIRDGHGIMFVSHTGDICPAGFLPLVVGNIRTRPGLGCVSQRAGVPVAARSQPVRRTLRLLRIQRALRRIAGARIRSHRRCAGLRPFLHLPTRTPDLELRCC